ncbi:MAG: (d)CMP kinase [Clostridiales bacterium]|nr:(d)CMP kinase [Clostridiales bacterium]
MINIAIDGPGGAGKSTVAKILAKYLGYIYVDTGALYRTLGLAIDRAGRCPDSEEDAKKVCQNVTLELKYVGDSQKVFLDGEDVSELIRTPRISNYASRCSALPWVREFLLETQRSIASKNHVIMDGRDIGTVVIPEAQIKIYLHADVEVRAHRRYLELKEKGSDVTYESVLEEMKERDIRDSTREIAPLKRADDAIDVDTTKLDLEQSIKLITGIVEERLKYVL